MTHRKLIEQMLKATSMLLSYTKACEGLLNCTPAGQIDIAEASITAAREYLAAPEQSEPAYWQWRQKNNPWDEFYIFRHEVFATTNDSEVRKLYTAAPQPTTPEPVNQMLLTALKEIDNWLVCWCIATPEDMAQSFGHMEQVASAAIAAAEQAPQPTDPADDAQGVALTDEEVRDALEAEFLGADNKRDLQDDLRIARAVLAAQKAKA